jgi:HEAT repeat protein
MVNRHELPLVIASRYLPRFLTSELLLVMKTLIAALLVVFGCVAGNTQTADVKSLVNTLKKTAQPGTGITAEEQEMAKKVWNAGAEAIPYLLPLLQDTNKDVRDLAGYTLRDINGLTEQDLDVLIESCRRGNGWIPPAIARIGTPKAVTFLVEELVRKRQTQTQFTYAIELLGQKAVPQLVQIYQKKDSGWDANLEATMCFVFNELGDKAAGAVEPLLKIATDEAAPIEKRRRAIAALGAIGLSAETIIPQLQKLRQNQNAKISDAATTAILGIGSAEAVPILVESLEAEPKRHVLCDIAALKLRGRAAGPTLVKYLDSDDWDVRIGAARALGYIGYEEASNHLAKLLNCNDDWRVVLSAAESLGRLKAKSAIPGLLQISTNHWYPPVRESAAMSLKSIREGDPLPSRWPPENFSFEFYDYEHAGRQMEYFNCEEAKRIRFTIAKTPDQSLTVTTKQKDGGKKVETCRGVKVEGGYLVGSDNGEWGGEITFIDLQGDSHVVVGKNTEAIYQTAQGIIAVTGLAHLFSNEGLIYKITKDDQGKWSAKKWRALPGAPIFSRLLKDGNLFVDCDGGIVLISPSGEMKSLSRSESLLEETPEK